MTDTTQQFTLVGALLGAISGLSTALIWMTVKVFGVIRTNGQEFAKVRDSQQAALLSISERSIAALVGSRESCDHMARAAEKLGDRIESLPDNVHDAVTRAIRG